MALDRFSETLRYWADIYALAAANCVLGMNFSLVFIQSRFFVKVIEDKIVRKPIRDEGDDGFYVRYIVEENGERKQYDAHMKEKGGVDPSYFVQGMANVEPGEEISLEMKKAGLKNYIEIVRISLGEVAHAFWKTPQVGAKGWRTDS